MGYFKIGVMYMWVGIVLVFLSAMTAGLIIIFGQVIIKDLWRTR